jgi:hypothetical protein
MSSVGQKFSEIEPRAPPGQRINLTILSIAIARRAAYISSNNPPLLSKRKFMKLLLVLATTFTFFASPAAHARSLIFTLLCQWDSSAERPASEPDYALLKAAVKKQNKWVTEYSLVITPRSGAALPAVFELEEASGDEDYLVFKAIGEGSENLEWITIQNKFKWAKFSNANGDYACR